LCFYLLHLTLLILSWGNFMTAFSYLVEDAWGVEHGDLGVVVVDITGEWFLDVEATTGEISCTARRSWGCSCRYHRWVIPWCWSQNRWDHLCSRVNSPVVTMVRWSCSACPVHTSPDRSLRSSTFWRTSLASYHMQASPASMHAGPGLAESAEQAPSSSLPSASIHQLTIAVQDANESRTCWCSLFLGLKYTQCNKLRQDQSINQCFCFRSKPITRRQTERQIGDY